MPHRCVCANCGNVKDVARNISLHTVPYYGDERPEQKRRRKRWVDFVKLKRAHWEPSKTSKVCSVHFKEEDFMRVFPNVNEKDSTNRWLRRDELGVCAFPSIHTVGTAEEKHPSDREKRMVR